MARIITEVIVSNTVDKEKSILFDALVDTGASHLVLPNAWKESKVKEPVKFLVRSKFKLEIFGLFLTKSCLSKCKKIKTINSSHS